MTPEKSSKRRKRANEQDLLRTSLSLGYQQIVPTTQSSARNHSKGNWQPLVLGLLISGGLSANAQAQRAPRAALVATPNAQIQKVPRATLVATPNAQMQRAPRATLVATPTPTPAPVVVTTPTAAGNVSETSTPISPLAVVSTTAQPSNTGLSPLLVCTIALLLLAGIVIGICIYRLKSVTESQSTNPPRSSKRPGRLYYDYDQFKAAMQRWESNRQLFEQNETARLEELRARVEKAGPLSCLGCLSAIIAAVLIGAAFGAGVGWGTVMWGALVVYLLMTAEQRFRR
jgi:hypothetical protein